MLLQTIFDLTEVCYQQGIRQVIMCPGSRCAPLTLAFVRHGGFAIKTLSDERSAAFVAMGIAQQTQSPVILICTSGTAGYNFAPAIAEAYFSKVPLIIFTADRPTEWIDQQDGQTIFQENIFGGHVKKFFSFPQHYEHQDDQWLANRMINEAIICCQHGNPGPVHINTPFREPFYPQDNNDLSRTLGARVITQTEFQQKLEEFTISLLKREWKEKKILCVVGQTPYDRSLLSGLSMLSQNMYIPVIGEITSQVHNLNNTINNADLFLGQLSSNQQKDLQPDLLITFGDSVISKALKKFLRNHPGSAHWHIGTGEYKDTFQHLTRVISILPQHFIETIRNFDEPGAAQKSYFSQWYDWEHKTRSAIGSYLLASSEGELPFVHKIMSALPDQCHLHLANSLSIRYADIIGLPVGKDIRVYANRGTSGIDGCTSTAMGHTLSGEGLHVLLTGDMAFFYDRNAFWHNYPYPNFRIILLNNFGGAIFKLIDGPSSLPECDPYFVTEQKNTAKHLCSEYGIHYTVVSSENNTNALLKDFFLEGTEARLLEFQSSTDVNQKIFNNLKKHIKEVL